ncbi:hypothetical protein GQ53DRAFT_829586 [Thozetella sp. PMI_491]|nr:hypothetical protein GQ53DRAFT_829586 [Thozetella sp. PMI_491]
MSAQLEEEKKQYEEQLEIVAASLKDDPDNAELIGLKDELDQMIKLIDDSLAELQPKAAPSRPAPKRPASPPPAEQKWSRENHPAFKKAAPEDKEPEPVAVSYKVNDTVMAKWVSGDKGYYPARITSVTGSSTDPIYVVKFKSYDTVETLRSKDIRPIAQKRKADGSAVSNSAPAPAAAPSPSKVASPSSSTPNSGIILSAGAEMYPQAQQAGKAAEKPDDEKPKPKFKKIKANKELEAGKNKWQEFSTKGKGGKSAKKDSMFRTPDGIHGRVGFTGSGQAMRKDPTRSRHIYQQNEDVD